MRPGTIRLATLVLFVLMAATVGRPALTQPAVAPHAKPVVNIVAIGASNTWGWGVSSAYPERLQTLLREQGYNANVHNAGILFDTTGGMLNRLDHAVVPETHIVILQPGGNDRRFLVSPERRAANIAEMVSRLQARKIEVIVYDPVFPPEYYQWDRIHITAEGHSRIASDLLPEIVARIPKTQR